MERASSDPWRWVPTVLRHVVVWIVAMVVGTTGASPVLAMGLVVPGQVIVPLSFCAGAALATVAAVWAGTVLDLGRTRGRLVPILRVGISTALVVSVVALVFEVGGLPGVSVAGVLYIAMAVITLNVSIATWRFREAGRNLWRDALLAVVLLGLTLGVVVAAIYSTCNLWYCSG
jgi:hypothetical protein